MKKLLIALLLISNAAFAQKTAQSGIVYKKHPDIETMRKLAALYEKGDADGMAKFYDEKVQFIGMGRYVIGTTPKNRTLTEARQGWQNVINNWNDLKMTESQPPIALQYNNGSLVVQSWWIISIVNKKTGKKATVDMVLFDEFNKEGKIISQRQYYDPNQMIDAAKE
jgi:hypothetical protein